MSLNTKILVQLILWNDDLMLGDLGCAFDLPNVMLMPPQMICLPENSLYDYFRQFGDNLFGDSIL